MIQFEVLRTRNESANLIIVSSNGWLWLEDERRYGKSLGWLWTTTFLWLVGTTRERSVEIWSYTPNEILDSCMLLERKSRWEILSPLCSYGCADDRKDDEESLDHWYKKARTLVNTVSFETVKLKPLWLCWLAGVETGRVTWSNQFSSDGELTQPPGTDGQHSASYWSKSWRYLIPMVWLSMAREPRCPCRVRSIRLIQVNIREDVGPTWLRDNVPPAPADRQQLSSMWRPEYQQ